MEASKTKMVIDDALARGRDYYRLSRLQWDRIVNARRRAESFVFTKMASRLIGRFSHECGDLILQHRQFAIPPYNDCYIEYDVDSYLEQFPVVTRDPTKVDGRIGYLISGQRLFIFVEGGKDGECFMMPIYYTMAPPGDYAPCDSKDYGRPIFYGVKAQLYEKSPMNEAELKMSEWNRLVCMLGTTIQKIHSEEERQSLLVEAQVHIMGAVDWDPKGLRLMMRGMTGEIRNLWSLLLWLNRPTHTTLSNVPPSRRFLRGHQIVYKAHRTVEIDLHKRKSVRRAFVLSGERLSPRRHNVRGAFHHAHGNVNCSHVWPPYPDDKGHWNCVNCGRLRWWVENHVRGDATRGWVVHDYSVTT